MKKTIATLLFSIACLPACNTETQDIDDSIASTSSNTCLIDFVDPQDGEGSSEQEIQEFVNKLDFDLVPAGIYSHSNHLYKKAGACPTIKSDLIENIEPSATYSLPQKEVVTSNISYVGTPAFKGGEPNDPLYAHQWNFKHLEMEKAWENSRQGKGVIVAVIDTGVAYKDHPKVNALEDMNETDFTKGVSFTRRGLPDGLDDHAHGSHVAGTIAQSTDNGLGVAGIAPKATIMPLKVLSASGSGSTEDIANAIRYAADNGAHVINMSLGGPYPSDIMEDAVNYAHEKGVTVVCAAGNDSSSRAGYPAGYDKCISVSSTDREKKLSWYSNYGNSIFVAAPGGDTRNDAYNGILQNTIDPRNIKRQGYYGFQGTSMAAPHVAGVAALIVGEGVKDNEEVWRILKETAKNPKNLEWDDQYGHGIINANDAVLMAKKSSGDGDEVKLPSKKVMVIGGVVLVLLVFVGFRIYRNLQRVEAEHTDFDSLDDQEE